MHTIKVDTVFVFTEFPVQVATTAPETPRELLAFGPDVARVLAVVALGKASLSSDDNMIKAIQLEYLLRFYISC
jgi:hypothetical protein